ncbi:MULTISPECIES: hypothetical protein [Aerosakkonema]|uniref:hypothetical protein n=1 Tax=Aerosakkonema TaxID=1246629 RepID=UPI0035B8C6C9
MFSGYDRDRSSLSSALAQRYRCDYQGVFDLAMSEFWLKSLLAKVLTVLGAKGVSRVSGSLVNTGFYEKISTPTLQARS